MLDLLVFWTFQVLNVPTAVGMFLFPRHFHQAMLKKPAAVYSALGFSPTAIAMLHNVLCGQGAALLAISGGVGYLRAAHPGSFLLIALTCGLSLIAHGCTALHHRKSAQVRAALGTINALYGILLLNGLGVYRGTVSVWLSAPLAARWRHCCRRCRRLYRRCGGILSARRRHSCQGQLQDLDACRQCGKLALDLMEGVGAVGSYRHRGLALFEDVYACRHGGYLHLQLSEGVRGCWHEGRSRCRRRVGKIR